MKKALLFILMFIAETILNAFVVITYYYFTSNQIPEKYDQ